MTMVDGTGHQRRWTMRGMGLFLGTMNLLVFILVVKGTDAAAITTRQYRGLLAHHIKVDPYRQWTPEPWEVLAHPDLILLRQNFHLVLLFSSARGDIARTPV